MGLTETNSFEKTLARQRICSKCRSFVTMEKVNDRQFACALCGTKLDAYVNLQGFISYKEIKALVAKARAPR